MRVKRQPEKLHHPTQWAVYVVSDSYRKNKAENQRNDEAGDKSPTSDSSTDSGVTGIRGELVTHSRESHDEYERERICGGASLKKIQGLGGVLTSITSCPGSSRIDKSLRNTELMHYFLDFVAPNLVSIEGNYTPPLFRSQMLPWMMQSQLFPKIGILMASVFQAFERGYDAETSPEPLAIKDEVLGMINRTIGSGVYELEDVVRSIINLAVIEWLWGKEESLFAHLRGLKYLAQPSQQADDNLAVRVDHAVAVTYERDLLIHDRNGPKPPHMPVPSIPISFLCPLLPDLRISFLHNMEALDLTFTAAHTLCRILRLTAMITEPFFESYLKSGRIGPISSTDIRAIASRLHGVLVSTSLEPDLVTQTLQLCAVILTASISTMQPISLVKTEAQSQILYENILAVGPKRWKEIPGIFLWILLVATPHPKNPPREVLESGDVTKWELKKKYLVRKMSTASQVISQEDFGLGIAYMRGFWAVQRFIVEAREGSEASP
ncbi:hypothetical protein QBC32DRAFT_208326 [Pseudoneurospora amorphoporcata]|uniref:Uncharacterized protein n=1 Tax=Pseudoneurospora amorphoporcata TaxID=241081 RepID=A0AAN6SI80_9PEZI|nr:hypothetical protein QBC32DRAFT_208326 [Pseudoneurospora amorphoporcata]